MYITRPISLGTEGRQLIVSGSQCSYTLVIPIRRVKSRKLSIISTIFGTITGTILRNI